MPHRQPPNSRHLPALGLCSLLAAFGGCQSTASADDAPVDVAEEIQAQADPADPGVVALLGQIEAATEQLKTLRGRVRYTVTQGLLGDQQRRFGDFYYAVSNEEHPTRFAIHFDRLIVDDRARPIDRRYTFDGNWLLEENHDDKNATRRELVPPGRAQDDVLMLGGNKVRVPITMKADTILAEYDVTRLEDEAFGEQTLIHLRLSPREDEGLVEEPIDLWFHGESKLLTKVVYLDNQGTEEGADDDTIELLLSLIRPNFEIAPETFSTTLPPADEDWQVQEVALD